MGIGYYVKPDTGEGAWDAPYSGKHGVDYVVKTEYDGAVLCDREHNYYDDSDGYSHVWDAEKQTIAYKGTWTTRAGTNHAGTKVDAFDGPYAMDILTFLRKWYLGVMQAKRSSDYDKDKEDALFPAVKGKRVRVVKGRKVPKGTEGVVIWAQEQSYSYYDKGWRIGIKDDNGDVHWTAASNAEVIDPDIPHPDDYETDAEIIERANTYDIYSLASQHCSYGAAMAGLLRL